MDYLKSEPERTLKRYSICDGTEYGASDYG